MSKKATTEIGATVFSAAKSVPERQKSLDIRQIRTYVEKLREQPDGAPMPDWSGLSVGDRFAIALRLIPSDQQPQLLGKSDGHIRRYERGLDIPLTVVAALAAETEIPMEWIVSGKAMDRLPPLIRIVPGNHDMTDVAVQKLAFKAAAGSGALMLDDSAAHHYVPRFMLQTAGVAPQNARLLEASGDSMKSTINDGDLMLVDVSPAATQRIVEGKIYVFSLGNEAYVKRLRQTSDRVIMISDNRELFPPEDVPAHSELRIYGRVMWAGRNL